MNLEFQKRQNEVLEILSTLAQEARVAGETLVFIGGSAVQTAVLKQPLRLSIDLDLYYSGDAEALLSKLIDYKIEKRPTKQQDLFSFYKVINDKVEVKVDIARFSLVNAGKPFGLKKLTIGKKYFEANVATPDYLLASKLAALAIGTVGRSPEKESFRLLDFLKDVFDANCLIDDFSAGPQMWKFFEQVCQIQNNMRNTNFTFSQVIESAMNALLDSALTTNNTTSIGKQHLSEFQNAYLLIGAINTRDYKIMTCRLAAYLSLLNPGNEENREFIKQMEQTIAEKYTDKHFIEACEAKLIEIDFEPKQLHELKVVAPQALAYLFAAKYPLELDKITDEKRGLTEGLKNGLKSGLKDGL
ncbi:MAG: nucleotidyl transferase AbiEii/AbiGii toxin family protein [Candidatus Micrarchaeota archaeon]